MVTSHTAHDEESSTHLKPEIRDQTCTSKVHSGTVWEKTGGAEQGGHFAGGCKCPGERRWPEAGWAHLLTHLATLAIIV